MTGSAPDLVVVIDPATVSSCGARLRSLLRSHSPIGLDPSATVPLCALVTIWVADRIEWETPGRAAPQYAMVVDEGTVGG